MTGMARERALGDLVDTLERAAALYWQGRDADAGELLGRAREAAQDLGLPSRGRC